MGTTAIKKPVPDRIKPSFVIYDIRTLWRSRLSVRVPGCQKLQMTQLYPYGNRGCQSVNLRVGLIEMPWPCDIVSNINKVCSTQ